MKRLTLLFIASALIGSAEEVTITKSTMLRAEKSAMSLKAGTVVELISRDDKVLTVQYKNITGTIPASSVDAATTADTPKKEEAKPAEPPPPPRKAETTYGKAVEKAKENAAKHDKNVVKPTDEILDK
jgi:hypothetical protein